MTWPLAATYGGAGTPAPAEALAPELQRAVHSVSAARLGVAVATSPAPPRAGQSLCALAGTIYDAERPARAAEPRPRAARGRAARPSTRATRRRRARGPPRRLLPHPLRPGGRRGPDRARPHGWVAGLLAGGGRRDARSHGSANRAANGAAAAGARRGRTRPLDLSQRHPPGSLALCRPASPRGGPSAAARRRCRRARALLEPDVRPAPRRNARGARGRTRRAPRDGRRAPHPRGRRRGPAERRARLLDRRRVRGGPRATPGRHGLFRDLPRSPDGR